jgi:hypothetical protein
MALELGVSPHAVEKRLKMARAKLGLSSSLDAARLLTASERYQRAGSQASDLAASEQVRKDGFTTAILGGVAAMTILVATAIVLAVSQAGSHSNGGTDTRAPARIDQSTLPPGNVAPSEAEIVHMTQTTFHHVDADNSGYIDGAESPIGAPRDPQPVYRRDEEGKVARTDEMVVMDEDEIRAQFYLLADKDGDGRISYPEFHHWSAPNLVRNGIPAAWREDIRRWMSTGG